MNFFQKTGQFLSWLSLDVVLGAMAGMFFFSELLHVELEWGIYLLLALAVWSIYTVDHLLDARRESGDLPARHLFHQKSSTLLYAILFVVILAGGIGAVWILGWKGELLLSGILGGFIVLSRFLIWKAGPALSWLKELSIAVYYVLGISWMPLLRAEAVDRVWEVYGFFLAYLILAFLNLLMLSFLDRKEDQSLGFTSAIQAISPEKMIGLIRKLGFGLIFLSLAGFILLPSFYRPFSCLILMMSLVHYLNFFNPKLDSTSKRMRMEIAFSLPLLLFLL